MVIRRARVGALLVYTLWKHPTLLPVLTTPAPVIPVLVGGADLMVPGGAQ
jgi:translation initiation factor 2D